MTYKYNKEQIAIDLLKCALSLEGKALLLGNITANDLVYLAATNITTCPSCGAEAWANNNCTLCNLCSDIIWKEE